VLTPDKPLERVTLRGKKVALEPLDASHLPGMTQVIEDGRLYDIPFTFVPRPFELDQLLVRAEAQFAASQALHFATIDIASGQVVGHTSFRSIERAHRRLEIGFTFIAQSWQRSHVNTGAKFLMLRHAFEEWGCLRVELLTDALNAASRAAILRIGAREEGILRNHMVMRDGRRRDSALYSIIDSDWPAVRQSLESRLAA
jgi:RimJ/RimL family protein N-acetyltransferase